MARQLDPHRAPGRRPAPQAPVSDSPVIACPPSDPWPLRWRGSSTRAPHPAADPRRRGSSTVAARPGRGGDALRPDQPESPPSGSWPLRWRGGSSHAAHRGGALRPDQPESPPACPPRVASPARHQPAAVLATGRRPLLPPVRPTGGGGAPLGRGPSHRPTRWGGRPAGHPTRRGAIDPPAVPTTQGAGRHLRCVSPQPGRRSAPAGRAGGKVRRICPPRQPSPGVPWARLNGHPRRDRLRLVRVQQERCEQIRPGAAPGALGSTPASNTGRAWPFSGFRSAGSGRRRLPPPPGAVHLAPAVTGR
jgi:hypothetical protein